MRNIFSRALVASLAVVALSGCAVEAAPAPAVTAPSTETNAKTQTLDDSIVIGSIDWDCYDVCSKFYVHKYCASSCAKY